LLFSVHARTLAHSHARTHARTHACKHARTHARKLAALTRIVNGPVWFVHGEVADVEIQVAHTARVHVVDDREDLHVCVRAHVRVYVRESMRVCVCERERACTCLSAGDHV
jgi:hypothetical protein